MRRVDFKSGTWGGSRKSERRNCDEFFLVTIEDILIPPDLHKSSVIRYRLNKIIFTERRSKKKRKREERKRERQQRTLGVNRDANLRESV